MIGLPSSDGASDCLTWLGEALWQPVVDSDQLTVTICSARSVSRFYFLLLSCSKFIVVYF